MPQPAGGAPPVDGHRTERRVDLGRLTWVTHEHDDPVVASAAASSSDDIASWVATRVLSGARDHVALPSASTP